MHTITEYIEYIYKNQHVTENTKYETLQACASISVPKLCNFHLQYLANFVKN